MPGGLGGPTSEYPAIEDFDDALYELDELMQRWKHRLTIRDLSLAERYLKGEIRLLVRLEEVGRAGEKLRAVLQGVSPISRQDGYAKSLEPFPCHSTGRRMLSVTCL